MIRRGPLQYGFGELEWLSYQLAGQERFPHQCFRVGLPADVPDAAVQQVIDLLVERHEVLRTTYGRDAVGDPEQIVRAPARVAATTAPMKDIAR